MDYSFIDKLLERYWQCATSLEEEEMLKAFFRQKEIPQRFEQYRSLFNYEDLAASEHLGADFDEKMIRMVEQPVVRARRIPFAVRFRPFFKAAAAVVGGGGGGRPDMAQAGGKVPEKVEDALAKAFETIAEQAK